jgi:transposase
VGMLAKIRRLHVRDGLPLREVARRTGLSRNTIRRWLRQAEVREPHYPSRVRPSVVGPWAELLSDWLQVDRHRPKRDRRTAKALYQAILAQGYLGGYGRVCAFVRGWKREQMQVATWGAYVPLVFELGEAFQFDWSCEYALIGGLRHRLEVAHTKLAASRAFWMGAYCTQGHEMLFDAHTRAFTALGGVSKRGIYDNMRTAVDAVGRGKDRTVNARFQALCSHYLFEPEFCNRAAGWEKGIVEKNVQDRRRQIWQAVLARDWHDLEELNTWLGERCRTAWQELRHPQWPQRTVAEVLEEERAKLMPMPRPFDGYLEQPARVTTTALVQFQRNRYSVPAEYAHHVISLRIYPAELVMVLDNREVARHVRCFERDQTCYDFRHYIGLIATKPGALRNGAPFTQMPVPLVALQKRLLKVAGGDRVMAQVLSAIPVQGIEAVALAATTVLEGGVVNREQVLNVLARTTQPAPAVPGIPIPLALTEEPRADAARYDQLLQPEASHE